MIPSFDMRADDVLLHLAQNQMGMLSTRQCLMNGWSRGKIKSRVRLNQLVPVTLGIFRLPGAPETWEAKVMAGCLRGGPHSAAWGPTAAAIWKLEGFPQRQIVIATTRNIQPFGDVAFKRVSRLGPGQTTKVGPLPVTSPPRTLLDIAGCRSNRFTDAAIDSALFRKLTTIEELDSFVEAESRQGVSGIERLRERLAARTPDGGSKRSFLESDFAEFIRAFELAVPKTNFLLMFEDGFTADVDAYWPHRQLVVEVQSEYHLGMTAMTKDAERMLQLESRGLTVVMITAEMIRQEPGRLAAQLRALLDGAPKNP